MGSRTCPFVCEVNDVPIGDQPDWELGLPLAIFILTDCSCDATAGATAHLANTSAVAAVGVLVGGAVVTALSSLGREARRHHPSVVPTWPRPTPPPPPTSPTSPTSPTPPRRQHSSTQQCWSSLCRLPLHPSRRSQLKLWLRCRRCRKSPRGVSHNDGVVPIVSAVRTYSWQAAARHRCRRRCAR